MNENDNSQHLSDDAEALMKFGSKQKSLGIAYLLWFFIGGFGAHRFYLARTQSAVIMLIILILSLLLSVVGIGLLGFVVIGIWWLVDLFLIPSMTSSFNVQLINALKRGDSL